MTNGKQKAMALDSYAGISFVPAREAMGLAREMLETTAMDAIGVTSCNECVDRIAK